MILRTFNCLFFMKTQYVQYGCGLSAPVEWLNFDVSPTLRIQQLPLVGSLLKSRLNVVFPDNVQYGDIIKGLPVTEVSCQGVYCSHTLEHLSLSDFRTALLNTFKILKPGGIFRCVVPDLEWSARQYLLGLDSGQHNASHVFMEETLLGAPHRACGLRGLAATLWGNSQHLWMWDEKSLGAELVQTGFVGVRRCQFNDSTDAMFRLVEAPNRFDQALAIECYRP
jgi:Methyltransferase domain